MSPSLFPFIQSDTRNERGDFLFAAENAYAVIGLAEATKVLKGVRSNSV